MAPLRVNPEMPSPVRSKPVFNRLRNQFPDAREVVWIPEHDFRSHILKLPEQLTGRLSRKYLGKGIVGSIGISVKHVLHIEVSIRVLLHEFRMSAQFLLRLMPYHAGQLDAPFALQ